MKARTSLSASSHASEPHANRKRTIRPVAPRTTESTKNEALALAILANLRAVLALMKRHDKVVERRTGLSSAQLWAMGCIDGKPGITVSELARQLGIHLSTASNMLDPLERDGYVGRSRVATDQRVVQLRLSGKGQTVLRRVPRPRRGVLLEALIAVPSTTLSSLDDALKVLLSHMHPDEPSDKHE